MMYKKPLIRNLKVNQVVFLSLIIIAIAGILIFSFVMLPSETSKVEGFLLAWTDKDQLEYANILVTKGLNEEAAVAFEEYIRSARVDRKELAKICYRVGSIYMGLYEYKKALSYYYKAEIIDKEGDFKEEMNRKIGEALKELGMTSQAKY